uniref:Clarin 3 n=1 Tax=Sus scrofa TaxID=9823 RepID=A0A8D1WGK1_PIG
MILFRVREANPSSREPGFIFDATYPRPFLHRGLQMSSFVTSLGAFVVISSILATQEWIRSTIAIRDSSSNGSVIITYGLLRGKSVQELNHGLAESDKSFEGLGHASFNSEKPVETVFLMVLTLTILREFLIAFLTLVNSICKPQTRPSPSGQPTWERLRTAFIFITLLLFVGNTQSNHLSEQLAQKLYPTYPASTHQGTSHSYGYSFWLVLLVILLNVASVVVIIFYQKARYQRKQEQRKPMEYAPRDGILF